jgi:predicted MFS family arabinose efflux permease
VNATFRGRYRAAAFGVWGAVISGAAAIGPLVGGALTQYASWQWVFVNLPLGLAIFALACGPCPRRGGRGSAAAPTSTARCCRRSVRLARLRRHRGPDLGWWTPKADLSIGGWVWPKTAAISIVPVCLAVAAVALTLFVVWERHRERVQRDALLDLTLFRLRTFSWGNVTAAMVAVGEFAIIFVLPLYLTASLGLSIMQTGLVLAAMAIGAFASGAAARHLAARFGSPAPC